MKTFLILGLSAAVFFVWQRESDKPAPTATAPRTSAAATAAPTARPVSEHNWAKHSLDRAQEAADQVRSVRDENEQH